MESKTETISSKLSTLKVRQEIKCNICNKHLSSKPVLKGHMLRIHEEKTKYICEICDSQLGSFFSLKIHKEEIHAEKRYACDLCKNTFVCKQYLKKHIQIEHSSTTERKTFTCQFCEVPHSYTNVSALNRHIKTTHEGKRYKCNDCDKTYVSNKELKFHSRRHQNREISKIFKCNPCDKTFERKYQLKQHERTMIHKKSKTFSCEICHKSYASLAALNNHIAVKHNEIKKAIQCHICDKTFGTLMSLKAHVKTHDKSNIFQCDDCGKQFLRKGDLKVHRNNLHASKTSTFPCGIENCIKVYQFKKALNRHIKIVHLKTELRQCQQCEKGYSTAKHLNRHVISVHTNISYKCDFCEKSYKLKDSLNDHIKDFHEGRINVCKICERSFPARGLLGGHMRRSHSDTVNQCEMCDKTFSAVQDLREHLRNIHGKNKD